MFPYLHSRRRRTGMIRVERKVRRRCGVKSLGSTPSSEGTQATGIWPRAQAYSCSASRSETPADTLSLCRPFSISQCSIQGRKARHAPPPLDGTETPRSRFSKCRKEEKRQKEYGGGAFILAGRPGFAKQGAPRFYPQGSPLPGKAGPRLWSDGENEG